MEERRAMEERRTMEKRRGESIEGRWLGKDYCFEGRYPTRTTDLSMSGRNDSTSNRANTSMEGGPSRR